MRVKIAGGRDVVEAKWLDSSARCKARAHPEDMTAPDPHALERRVRGNTGAQQRRNSRKVGLREGLGHFDNKMAVDDDGAAVAAVGGVALLL